VQALQPRPRARPAARSGRRHGTGTTRGQLGCGSMTAPNHSDRHPCLGRSPSRRVCRGALSLTLLGALVACRAPSPRTAAPDRVPPPPAAHELGDASYDWRGLLIAPFGSVLKDIPVALHEVLLFRDDAHGNAAPGNAAPGSAGADAAAVDAECYAADAPAPRFVGRIPEEYLLCFKQDRLSRIQASVRVPAAQAAEVFAAACTGWLKNAASTPGAEAPGGWNTWRRSVRRGPKCRRLRGPRRRHSLPRPARGGTGSGGNAPTGIGLVDYLRQRSLSLSSPPATRESELELLAAGARDIGIAVDSSGAEALLKLVDELEAGNAQFNLTAIRDRLGMLRKHVLDTLRCSPTCAAAASPISVPARVFRGLPLAIVNPQRRFYAGRGHRQEGAVRRTNRAPAGVPQCSSRTCTCGKLQAVRTFRYSGGPGPVLYWRILRPMPVIYALRAGGCWR